MAGQRFPASLDGLIKGVTAAFWGGMLVGAAIVLLVPGVPWPLRVVLVPLMLASPILTWALAPRGYHIDGGAFVIERPFGNIAVPLASITGAQRVTKADLGWLIRTFGSGGAHGIYGRFRSSTLGPLDFKATRRDRMVLIRRGERERPLVITPDDPDTLLAALPHR